jgi:hypothetical protein
MLSRLPIYSGDRVYMLLVVSDDDDCHLLTLPLIGTYNDYGTIADIEPSANLACWVEILKSCHVDLRVGKVPSPQTPAEVEAFLQQVLPNDLLMRSDAWDSDVRGEAVVTPRFVLAHVWDALYVETMTFQQDIALYRAQWHPLIPNRDPEREYFRGDVPFAPASDKYSNSLIRLYQMRAEAKRVYHTAVMEGTALDSIVAQTLAFLWSLPYLRVTWDVSESGSQASAIAMHLKLHEVAYKYAKALVKRFTTEDLQSYL